MVFNRYIAISLLSHLLFFSILGIMRTVPDISRSVFNVNIVAPPEKHKPVPEVKAPPPVKKKKPAKVIPPKKKIIPMSQPKIDDTLKPSTMYGKSSYPSPNVEADSKGNSASSSPKKEQDPILSEKDGISIVPGSILFDKKTIEKYAAKKQQPKTDLVFNAPGFKHRGYTRMLNERIRSVWEPKGIEFYGMSVVLEVVIVIKRDGSLDEIELLRTSGYVNIDDAVIRNFKKAFPWASLPKDFKRDKLSIRYQVTIYNSTYFL